MREEGLAIPTGVPGHMHGWKGSGLADESGVIFLQLVSVLGPDSITKKGNRSPDLFSGRAVTSSGVRAPINQRGGKGSRAFQEPDPEVWHHLNKDTRINLEPMVSFYTEATCSDGCCCQTHSDSIQRLSCLRRLSIPRGKQGGPQRTTCVPPFRSEGHQMSNIIRSRPAS